jgi:hypothetical protein
MKQRFQIFNFVAISFIVSILTYTLIYSNTESNTPDFDNIVNIKQFNLKRIKYKFGSNTLDLYFNSTPISNKWCGEIFIYDKESDSLYYQEFPRNTSESMGFIYVKKGWNKVKIKAEYLSVIKSKKNRIQLRFFPVFDRKYAYGDLYIYGRTFISSESSSNFFYLNEDIKSNKIILVDKVKFEELNDLDKEYIQDSIQNILH